VLLREIVRHLVKCVSWISHDFRMNKTEAMLKSLSLGQVEMLSKSWVRLKTRFFYIVPIRIFLDNLYQKCFLYRLLCAVKISWSKGSKSLRYDLFSEALSCWKFLGNSTLKMDLLDPFPIWYYSTFEYQKCSLGIYIPPVEISRSLDFFLRVIPKTLGLCPAEFQN
jgi:hypothetical protein